MSFLPARCGADVTSGRKGQESEISQLYLRLCDLCRRLDESEAERRQAQERLTALLTDQRPAAQPEAHKSFWRRLLGK